MKRSPQPYKKTTSNVWMSRVTSGRVAPKVKQLFDSASDIITIDDSLDMIPNGIPSVQIVPDTFENNNDRSNDQSNDHVDSLPSQMPYIASAARDGGEVELSSSSTSSNKNFLIHNQQQLQDDIVIGPVIAPMLSQDDGAWDVSFFTEHRREDEDERLPSVGNSPVSSPRDDSEDSLDDGDFTQVISKLEPIRAFGSMISSLGETDLSSTKKTNNSIKSRRREMIRNACSKLRSRMNQSISDFESELLSVMECVMDEE